MILIELHDTGRRPLDKPHPRRIEDVIAFARLRGFTARVVEPTPAPTPEPGKGATANPKASKP